MNGIAYYNGIFSTPDQIRIPLSDRSVYFGDGIYDAAIARNGKIYLADEHIRRFFKSAVEIGLDTSDIRAGLPKLLESIAARQKTADSFLYFQLTRDGGVRKHAFSRDSRVNLLITLTPIPHPDITKPLRVMTRPDERHSLCHIKTLNVLPAVLACADAECAGYDEAVLIRDGIVTECSHSSIFIVKDGRLITHPLNNRILPGIMRKKAIEIAKLAGIHCEERCFTKDELYSADEVLITSSSRLGAAVRIVDSVEYPINRGGICELLLREMYSDYLHHTV